MAADPVTIPALKNAMPGLGLLIVNGVFALCADRLNYLAASADAVGRR